MRGHVGPSADDRRQPRALPDLDGMNRELARHLLVDVAPHRLREVLDEIPASRDVQELEAAADRQRRQVALERRDQERQLARVTPRLGRVRLGMGVGAVARGIDVRPAGEHDAVEDGECLLHPVLAGREKNGAPARPLDGIDVVEWDQRSRELPDAPARVLRVRGDADERPHASSVSTPHSVPTLTRARTAGCAPSR